MGGQGFPGTKEHRKTDHHSLKVLLNVDFGYPQLFESPASNPVGLLGLVGHRARAFALGLAGWLQQVKQT